jgi:hypothetical protein
MDISIDRLSAAYYLSRFWRRLINRVSSPRSKYLVPSRCRYITRERANSKAAGRAGAMVPWCVFACSVDDVVRRDIALSPAWVTTLIAHRVY